MPSFPIGLTRSAHDLRVSGFADTQGHASKFIQVLDESMCVVREDICDWLQRYLFSSVNAPPIEGRYLLYRLASGLWLSRLAYKLHCSVLQNPKTLASQPTNITRSNSHEFLRGGVSNPSLRTLSRDTLPPFPDTLVACAKLPLGYSDTCPYSDGEKSDESSAPSSSSSPDHVPVNSKPESKPNGIRVADLWTARDNVSTFIHWCKDLGIPCTVLFETTGLVNRTEEKNVLLTLMELARIASRFGLDDLPELVRMEREIDLLEAKRTQASIIVTGRSPSPSVTVDVPLDSGSRDGSSTHVSAVTVQLRKHSVDSEPEPSTTAVKVGASGDIVNAQTTVRIGGKMRQVNIVRVCGPHSQTIDLPVKSKSGTSVGTDPVNVGSDASCGLDGSSSSSNVMLDSAFSYSSSSGVSISTASTSTDDKSERTAETSPDSGCLSRASSTDRVAAERAPADPFVADQVEKKVAQCTCCNRLHLQHLEEGRYRLGTRVYYFRRFRNHVMVRVGGGWLTLDAFLERHDPCRRGKSSQNNLSVVPNTNAPTTTMTPDLSKRKFSEQVPEIKPPLVTSGSMVDLRRRWSKHSTSSNESAASCNSVPVNATANSVGDRTTDRVSRNRSPNPLGSRKPGTVAARKTEVQNNGSRPATPVSNPAKALAQTRAASAGRRRVTPSPNTRGSNAAAKDSKPVRWR